jgi:ankyrin repeat protein
MKNSRAGITGVLSVAVLLAAAPAPDGHSGNPVAQGRLAVAESPVADAAERGDVAAVQSLIRTGADVNAAQGDGMTALHWAAYHGNAGMTTLLVRAKANTKAVTRLGHYTPLHLAAKGGFGPIVRILVDAGSPVNALTSTGDVTPLHFAGAAGSVESITALLDHGADINARETARGQTPLMFAASFNRLDALKTLLKRGADLRITSAVVDLPVEDAVDRAAGKRRDEVLAGFRAKAEDTLTWRPDVKQVQTAVKAAEDVQKNTKDATAAEPQEESFLGSDEVAGFSGLVGRMGGLTALLHAVREGNTDCALALLDAGADINIVSDGDHTSPLLMAVINGNFDLALTLLAKGADPNLASDAGSTPLFDAINTQWAPRSRYPQQHAYMLQKTTYLDLMKALLDAGANPNARLTKHLWYMSYTFDLLGVDTRGATPFWRAAYATDVEAMRMLVAYGADPDIPTLRPAERRRRGGGGRGGAPRQDPSGLPPIPVDGPGVYPIHAASGVGYGEGYAGNAHRHVPDGWLPAVKYLVEELGADVNARDFNGYNPVHHAAARGDNQLIEYLVSKDADVTAVSRRGQTTADMANGPVQRISPFPETVALLERLGSKNNHRCLSC